MRGGYIPRLVLLREALRKRRYKDALVLAKLLNPNNLQDRDPAELRITLKLVKLSCKKSKKKRDDGYWHLKELENQLVEFFVESNPEEVIKDGYRKIVLKDPFSVGIEIVKKDNHLVQQARASSAELFKSQSKDGQRKGIEKQINQKQERKCILPEQTKDSLGEIRKSSKHSIVAILLSRLPSIKKDITKLQKEVEEMDINIVET